MPAAIHDLIRDHGETRNILLTNKAGNVPVDLTGSAIWLEIAPSNGAPTRLDTTNGGIILTAPVAGKFEIDPSHASYTALSVGIYSYRLMIVPPGGESRMIMRGKWTIR